MDLVEQHYREWVVVPFYVVVSGYNEYTHEQEYACFRSAKRGDKKYSNKVLNRFDLLKEKIPFISYFSWGTRDRSVIRSPCVLATFEYSHETTVENSWELGGIDFNRWITGMRKAYGKIDVVRAFESHESGYCHIHAVLYFHEKEWLGFRWDHKNKIQYRVDDREAFRKNWKGGFSDILLLQNSHAGFTYLSKYLTKCVAYDKDDVKGTNTLSMCWFFRKRSFAISGALTQLYSDVINDLKSNSNLRCDVELCFNGSVVFCGVAEWFLYGFVKGFVDGWGDHWRRIPVDELVELESSGQLEQRSRVH